MRIALRVLLLLMLGVSAIAAMRQETTPKQLKPGSARETVQPQKPQLPPRPLPPPDQEPPPQTDPAEGEQPPQPGEVRPATAAFVSIWNDVMSTQLDADALNPDHHYVGFAPARKTFEADLEIISPDASVNNWYPVDGYKHKLIGRFQSFNLFAAESFGPFHGSLAENDWCTHIIPNDDYKWVIDDVRARQWDWSDYLLPLDSDWYQCPPGSGVDCLEGEVTGGLTATTRWFTDEAIRPEANDEIGAYGTWVAEWVHGNRPEIHPSEMLWWKKGENTWYLLLLQDASKRFHTDSRFDGDTRPWAGSPVTGQFRVAFEVPDPDSPNFKPLIFTINQMKHDRVSTDFYGGYVAGDQSPDSSADGKHHDLTYKGKTIVTAIEQQERDQDIGVRLIGATHEGKVIGFVTISSHVGNANGEGYNIVRVDRTTEALQNAVVTFKRVRLAQGAIPHRFAFRFKVNDLPAKTFDRRFVPGTWVNLPAGEFKFPVEEGSMPLRVNVMMPLQSITLIDKDGKKTTSGPRNLSVTREYAPPDFGRGTHAEASSQTDWGGIRHEEDLERELVSFEVEYAIETGQPFTPVHPFEPRLPVTSSIIGRIVPESLRRIDTAAGPRLAADVELYETRRLPSKVHATASAAALTTPSNEHFPLALAAAKAGNESMIAIVTGVPVTAGGKLVVQSSVGQVEVPIVPTAVAPRMVLRDPVVQPAAADAWQSLATVAKAANATPDPALPVMRVEEWPLNVMSGYAPIRGGRPSREDESPVAEELTRAVLRKDSARLTQLFGSASPFRAEWTFEARNLATREPVPVAVNRAPKAGEIAVTFDSGAIPNETARVRFPASGQPFVVLATARITDVYGNSGTIRQAVWSHVIRGTDRAHLGGALFTAAPKLANVDAAALNRDAALNVTPGDYWGINDVRRIRARGVRVAAMQAALDGQITPDELSAIVNLTKQFNATPSHLQRAIPRKPLRGQQQ